MLERKEIILLNGVEIDLNLVDGHYYYAVLEDGTPYLFKHESKNDLENNITQSTVVVNLDTKFMIAKSREDEVLTVADDSLIDHISEIPTVVGDSIIEILMGDDFPISFTYDTDCGIIVKEYSDDGLFTPRNFIESMYKKSKEV